MDLSADSLFSYFFEKKVSKEALHILPKKHLLAGHTHTGQQVLLFYLFRISLVLSLQRKNLSRLILIRKVAQCLCLLDDLVLEHLRQGLIPDELEREVAAALGQLA